MSHRITKADLLGLWSLFWRVALFGTILFPFAATFFVLRLVSMAAPPVYALGCFIEGRVLLGAGVVLVWLGLMWFGRRFLRRFT